MSQTRSSMVSVRPTAAGSPPKRRCQSAYAEDRHPGAAVALLPGAKGTPDHGLHPEHVERVRGHIGAGRPLGMAAPVAEIRRAAGGRRDGERPAPLGVVEILRIGQGRLGPPVPSVPHRDQPAGLGIRQGTQQHRVGQAEDRRVGADSQRQRQHRDGREPGVRRQPAQRVPSVLPDLREVLARPDRQQFGDRAGPDADQPASSPRRGLAALLAEHLLDLPAVVGAEVAGQHAQQAAEPAVPAHVSRPFGISRFARAIPSADSMRLASARATSRPKSVNR